MKILSRLSSLVLIGALVFLLNLGCASTGSEGGGLTLQQTHQQVEDAMLVFRNASIAGNTTTAQTEAIQAAYKQYQAVYEAALAQAGSDEKAPAPDNVKAAAEDVKARVAAMP